MVAAARAGAPPTAKPQCPHARRNRPIARQTDRMTACRMRPIIARFCAAQPAELRKRNRNVVDATIRSAETDGKFERTEARRLDDARGVRQNSPIRQRRTP